MFYTVVSCSSKLIFICFRLSIHGNVSQVKQGWKLLELSFSESKSLILSCSSILNLTYIYSLIKNGSHNEYQHFCEIPSPLLCLKSISNTYFFITYFIFCIWLSLLNLISLILINTKFIMRIFYNFRIIIIKMIHGVYECI